jgi:salicylate hydroxylase
VSPSLIQLRKRLRTVDDSGDETFLEFEDGSRAGPFHLVVGADGLRSAVRQHAFPDHKIAYTGKVAYRVLIPQEKVAHIPNIPPGSCFWHTPSTHVYTNPLDNGLFEIATRATESEEHGNKVSWGQVVPKSQVVKHYQEYCNTIRAVIDAPDEWLEFAMFGGPKLETVISGGRIVLIGDASHRERAVISQHEVHC